MGQDMTATREAVSGSLSLSALRFSRVFARSIVISRARRRRTAHEFGRRRFDERGTEALFPIVDAARELALHVLHELVDLLLHPLHFAAHVEDDLDAGKIDAEVARQRKDGLELLEILLGVETRIALGARRFE